MFQKKEKVVFFRPLSFRVSLAIGIPLYQNCFLSLVFIKVFLKIVFNVIMVFAQTKVERLACASILVPSTKTCLKLNKLLSPKYRSQSVWMILRNQILKTVGKQGLVLIVMF